jgi:hypothetical protein
MNLIKKKDPSTRPSTEFLCKPIRGIMEEKSMTRNLEGGIIVRGIIEKESLRRHSGGAIIEEGACRRHLGASGNPLGALWAASAWESSGGHLEGLRLRRHLGHVRRSDRRNRCLSQLERKSSIQI